MMDGWNMNGWGWGWMALMMVVSVLIVALLALAIARGALPRRGDAAEGAQRVLRRRFAAGEIDETEFRQRRAVLSAQDGSSDPASP